MKVLVFLLVLGNLLFYAFSAGYFGRPDDPDAGRVEQQVMPERMRIVSRGEAPAAPAKPEAAAENVPVAPEATAPANEAVDPAAPDKTAKVDKPPVCLSWRQLSLADADRLSALLTRRFGDYKQSRKTVAAEGGGWWVFIAPPANKGDAEKKAGELRELGIKDFFIVQDGAQRSAISLGVFSSEKGAQERLAELKAKGVRTALLAPRPGKENLVALQARGPAGDKAAIIAAAGDMLPKAEAQACK